MLVQKNPTIKPEKPAGLGCFKNLGFLTHPASI